MKFKFIIVGKNNVSAQEVLHFENLDLENVITPVDVKKYEHLLKTSNYDKRKTEYLVSSFKTGFRLGYTGPKDVKMTSPNLKFRGIGNEVILWNKVMKEVQLKRYAGPFKEIPYDNYIQSPIGLVPKDNGRNSRLIFHLSYPRGRGTSVNENTDKSLCSVKYPDFSEAIILCIIAGKNCKMSKSDMTSAFRHLGMSKMDFCYLIMKAKDPTTGETFYFIDKCLPFGASISCAHFQSFSDSVAHIVRSKTLQDLINYLDDYFFVALLSMMCNAQVKEFINICDQIRFPISMEKTFWATTQLVFLGLLIDSAKQIVCIPKEKVDKALTLISKVLDKSSRKITLNQLQKICGFLNFLGRAIIPGRAFTRRLYSYTSNPKLKPHHHIRIDRNMKDDLTMWRQFLSHQSIYA